MFNRRLHMLFPKKRQAASAVQELHQMGLSTRQMHTIARAGIDLSGLPEATVRQRSDTTALIEQWLWNANLALFFIAFLSASAAMLAGLPYWVLAGLMVMLLSFVAGNYFTSHVPHVHMTDYQNAIGNGEVLLLVDIPLWRVHGIESRIRTTHPEMELGGVSWTVELMGI